MKLVTLIVETRWDRTYAIALETEFMLSTNLPAPFQVSRQLYKCFSYKNVNNFDMKLICRSCVLNWPATTQHVLVMAIVIKRGNSQRAVIFSSYYTIGKITVGQSNERVFDLLADGSGIRVHGTL